MSTDAAGGVEDSAVRGNAEPPQDGVQVAGLLLARGPRVLVNGKEHLGMAEEQVFGPVGRGHWLAMRLPLFFGGGGGPGGGGGGFGPPPPPAPRPPPKKKTPHRTKKQNPETHPPP